MNEENSDLPTEIADRLTRPFARLLKIKVATGVMLFAATVVALTLSNSKWATPFSAFWEIPIGLHFGSLDFTRSLRLWINEGLMTLFFFVVALELKRSLVLAELQVLRVTALSFAGALGGMLVPATLYMALVDDQLGMHSWGTVVATDTAFVIGCLALLGSRIPSSLRLFLLSLAIFDDVGAILVVAFGYGDTLNWAALGLAALVLISTLGAMLIGIRSAVVYFLLASAIWLCFDASGINPTFAGVVLGLMTSTHGWVSDDRLRAILGRVLAYPRGEHWSGDTVDRRDLQRAGVAVTETLSPVERLETALHPWVGFLIMPLFAFANAGVTISGTDIGHPVVAAIFVGLVFGKPIGVIASSWLAVHLGLATKPPDLSWSLLAAGGLLAGIGFTMSLFIAGLAFPPSMLDAAKVGILAASMASAAAGLLTLVVLTSKSPGPS
jgi:NhaA family Na+:H+ antiporter